MSEQEVPTSQVSMMSALLHEVRNQRERIDELAEMMRENPSPCRNPETVSVMTESDLESWEIEQRGYHPPSPQRQPVMNQARTTLTSPPKTKSTAAGKGSFNAPSPTRSHTSDFKSGWNLGSWKPIADEPSSGAECSTTTATSRSGMDHDSNGALGAETSELGKEASRQAVFGRVRDRCAVRGLVPKSHQLARGSDQRFCSVYCQTRQQMEEQLRRSQGFA